MEHYDFSLVPSCLGGSSRWLGGSLKRQKPRLRGSGETVILSAPRKFQPPGMKGVRWQNQAGALPGGQPAFDQREIQIGITSVKLVADDGMAEMREMQAELVFATGERAQAQTGKRRWQMANGSWGIFARRRRRR